MTHPPEYGTRHMPQRGTWRVRVPQGQMLPRGYGCAWIDYASYEKVCYPVPLNLLARWARAVWFVLAQPARQEAERRARHSGYLEGQVAGMHAALRAMAPVLDKLEPLRAALEWALDLLDVNDRLIAEKLPEAWESLNRVTDTRAKAKARALLAAERLLDDIRAELDRL